MSNVAKERAALDLQAIQQLKECAPYTEYFLRRLQEKIADREAIVLNPDTTPEETTIQKRIIQALREDALTLLDKDAQGCVSLLEQ